MSALWEVRDDFWAIIAMLVEKRDPPGDREQAQGCPQAPGRLDGPFAHRLTKTITSAQRQELRETDEMASITFSSTQEITHGQLASILRKALSIPAEMTIHVESMEQGIRIHTSQEVQLASRRGLEEKFGACLSSLVANSNGLGHKH